MITKKLFGAAALLWLPGFVAANEPRSAPAPDSAVVKMEPVYVRAVLTSIKVRPFYRDSVGGPRIWSLRFEEVRLKSAAERAGLVAGLEILAVNGVNVRGLDELELEKLWRGPFAGDVLTFRVVGNRAGFVPRPFEVKIPLLKEPPAASVTSADRDEALSKR